ncbi:MAG: hypothetical protein ACI92I_000066 [Acidimicrobiales bacterium]|jgi:hypothetical protein
MYQANFNQSLERRELKCTRAFYYTPIQIFSLMATLAIFFFSFSLFPQNVSAYGSYANPDPVDIGTADDFTVIGKTGITSDLLTTYGGNIGVSPSAAATLTDVTCANMTAGRMYTITAPTSPVGCITTASTSVADIAKLSAATDDFDAAYLDARNQSTHPYDITSGAIDIGIGVKGRGIYNYTGAVSMDTNLVLRGSDTDIWIFQVTGAKTQAAGINMVLQNEAGVENGANGPRAGNIFWAIDGAPSQGAPSHFVGVVMSTGAITLGAGATYVGRAFSDGTVSVDTSDFSTPADLEQSTLVTVGQTISSPSLFGSPSFVPLSTTGGSGTGAVSFAVTTAGTAGCSIAGTTLSYSTGGTCTVTATKAGDTNYFVATSTPATFTVNLGTEATIITNQGTGTYSFNVTSGTLNASDYEITNTDIYGLNISNTPTISDLSNGSYILTVDSGSSITVSAEALNANSPKVFTNVAFSTLGAITGFNAALLLGTTNNTWEFTGSDGNIYGEAFDDDGMDACGFLRWDDSLCFLIEQTHYRWRNDDGGLGVPDSEWFNTNWDKRKRVRIQNQDSATYSSTSVKIEVTYDADMQAGFDDLRFTDNSGMTEIPFWVETLTASVAATVWVQVPTLPANDIATVFMYYENAVALSSSSIDTTFIMGDDFEDGDIAEYSGDTGKFAVDATFAFGGSYGLDNTGSEGLQAIDGIYNHTSATTSQGEIIRYMQYIDTSGGGDEVCTLFAVQDPGSGNDNYAVCTEQVPGTDRISLAKNVVDVDSSGTILASTSVAYTSGWYEVEIDWQTNDNITVTLSKDGSEVASTTANDNSYTQGGIGFTYWFNNGGWDGITSRVRVDTEPTVYFGAEQVGGGASWRADIDTFTSDLSPGDTARLRLLVENSGPQIAGSSYLLEFAEQGVAPSCEAVDGAGYAAVPPQVSCGVSPVCMQSSGNVIDGESTTDLLSIANGTFTSGKLTEDPSNPAGTVTLEQDEYTELEYVITPTLSAFDENICLRVTDGGAELDTYLSVAKMTLRFDPTFGAVTFNDGADISLVPGTTTRVYASSTVTDLNGYNELTVASSTMYTTSAGALCTPDNNDCYVETTSSQCSFSNCAGNSCTLMCYADFFYHADATDTDGANQWWAFFEVEDVLGGYGFGTSPSVEVQTLRALDVNNAINYVSLSPSSDTGAINASSTLENLGNVEIDIDIEGTALTDGYDSSIPASEQIFATSTFNYPLCVSCTSLATTATSYRVDLAKPTTTISAIIDDVFWGISIPFGVSSATHTGGVTFTPISPF